MPTAYPHGIDDSHAKAGAKRHASWWRLGILVLILGAALFGLLGGAPAPTHRVETPAAMLAVTSPDRLRNGMFFETRIAVVAKRPVADAVIAIPAGLWRDSTVNTIIPAPASEEFRGGDYRFHFGPLAPGARLAVKIDGQINPPRLGRSGGRIRLLDGEAELAAVAASLTVIP